MIWGLNLDNLNAAKFTVYP